MAKANNTSYKEIQCNSLYIINNFIFCYADPLIFCENCRYILQNTSLLCVLNKDDIIPCKHSHRSSDDPEFLNSRFCLDNSIVVRLLLLRCVLCIPIM
jgi:hypothetical protein